MSATEEPHITVDNTMGAAFIGVICAASLYGVSCVQTWFYFNRYPGDLWYIKCLVAIVWLFDSIHQALISHTVYFYVVTNFNNVSEQANLVWSILLEVLFNGLIGFVVQSFLTMRVWKMSNQNKPLTVLIVLFVLGELTCSVAFTISSLKLVTWMDLTHLKSLSMTVNVLGAVADVMIAAGLFYFLHRSRTGFKKSDTMISKLIMFTVSTGLLTSICAVASLLSILIWGKTLIYVAFYFSLGRLYSNSLLATLNARKSIRGLNDGDGGNVSFSLQTFSNKLRPSRRNMTMAPNQTNISIKIDTTQELIRDKATKEKDFESDITDVGRSEDTSEAV
ncbi:hypothetical protein DFJ43DRAFT_1062714 [Lentinula guzmanii]|uniref:DUF6534 domain-containing protein n=1 Tax=Lentinula guzmanii TaxID=2804957 RepID=A0AA38JG92_9AGAR|nr:hypothetical protein DFJ43DRAFT_1062714 [Lentinula guzmanii]